MNNDNIVGDDIILLQQKKSKNKQNPSHLYMHVCANMMFLLNMEEDKVREALQQAVTWDEN